MDFTWNRVAHCVVVVGIKTSHDYNTYFESNKLWIRKLELELKLKLKLKNYNILTNI